MGRSVVIAFLREGVNEASDRLGGLDIAVLNAGYEPNLNLEVE